MKQFKNQPSIVTKAVSFLLQLKGDVQGLNCCYTKAGRAHSMEKRELRDFQVRNQGMNGKLHAIDKLYANAVRAETESKHHTPSRYSRRESPGRPGITPNKVNRTLQQTPDYTPADFPREK